MSVQLEADRIRNTYYYALTSDQGEIGNNDIGAFSFNLPPFPYPEHNSAQRCIFTLQGFVIGDQVANQQIGQTTYFSLDINGMGLSAQNYNSTSNFPAIVANPALNLGLTPSNRFLIPNIFEEFSSTSTAPLGAPNAGDIYNNVPIQRITGSYELVSPYVLLCSNPVGKNIICAVFNDQGVQIGANPNMNSILRFKIELIPDS
jgi:hypothetical protein